MKIKNPIIAYFVRREWEWIPQSKICSAVNCNPSDIQKLLDNYHYSRSIEVNRLGKEVEYRYISNKASHLLTAVNYLKFMYPQWCTGSQISKHINSGQNFTHLLIKYIDVIPIECRSVYINRQKLNQYRYVPNDKRSLMDREFAPSKTAIHIHNRQAKTTIIHDTLKSLNGKWITAKSLAEKVGMTGGRVVVVNLTLLRKRDPNIEYRLLKGMNAGQYRYIGESPA